MWCLKIPKYGVLGYVENQTLNLESNCMAVGGGGCHNNNNFAINIPLFHTLNFEV